MGFVGAGFDFQAEWLDSTYKNYVTPEGLNLDGQPTGEPNLSASIGASYVFQLGNEGGDLRLSARHAYRGEQRCNDGSDLQGDCGSSSALDLGDVDAPLGDVLVCGDNAEAKQKVMEVISRIGARTFDGGTAAHAYVIEGLTGVIIHLNRKYKSKHGSIRITGIEPHASR